MIKIIVLIICCLVLTIRCAKVPENFQDIQMRVESTIKQVKQTAETIHKKINLESIKNDMQQDDKENDLKKNQQEQDSDSEFEEQVFGSQKLKQKNSNLQEGFQHNHQKVRDHLNQHSYQHTDEYDNDHKNQHNQENQHIHEHNLEDQDKNDNQINQHYSQNQQSEENSSLDQRFQDEWKVQLSFIPNYQEIYNKIIKFQYQLPKLLEKYLPNSKQDQVNYSIFIVSFPSLPIFLLLLITVGIRNRGTTIQYMIAFSFGTMLGDVFFHMFPQIQGTRSHHSHGHDHDNPYLFLILGGVLLFTIIDIFIIKLKNLKGTRDISHDHEHNNSVMIFLLGDFLHNFTDGIALAATYSISKASGITTTIAIFMHEIPHEIGDFAYLLKQGKCVFVILSTQIFTSLGCLLGGYVGLQFAQTYQQELLCLTCGSFLYVALVNILPELKQSFSYRPKFERLIINLFSMAAGLYLMKFVGQLE